jgi:hypothetical protein
MVNALSIFKVEKSFPVSTFLSEARKCKVKDEMLPESGISHISPGK